MTATFTIRLSDAFACTGAAIPSVRAAAAIVAIIIFLIALSFRVNCLMGKAGGRGQQETETSPTLYLANLEFI
jgi:hypothetical protein